MLGEVELALLDWCDEAREDLLLVALNGSAPQTLEAYLALWRAVGTVVEIR